MSKTLGLATAKACTDDAGRAAVRSGPDLRRRAAEPPGRIRGAAERETLTVARHEGRWAVEHQGVFSDHTAEKEEAKAAANKRARALQDQGRACQVRVSGEHGFFADA